MTCAYVCPSLRCTLVGPPNAGKSSLLNVLAGRAAAIVSPVPGTTRDIVQVRLDIGGDLNPKPETLNPKS